MPPLDQQLTSQTAAVERSTSGSLTITSPILNPVTGQYGDTTTKEVDDSRNDRLSDLLMLSGTSRTLQSFNNNTDLGTTNTWLSQQHYDIYCTEYTVPPGTPVIDAGAVITAALAWSSEQNISGTSGSQQAPPTFTRSPLQTARVLITERAVCPLKSQIIVPAAGNCYVESITGEPLLSLIAMFGTKSGPAIDGIIVNGGTPSPSARPRNVKLAGFSISKAFSYLTGWFDGVIRQPSIDQVTETDGTAGLWEGLKPLFAAAISIRVNPVIAMQQSNLLASVNSAVYFDGSVIDGSLTIQTLPLTTGSPPGSISMDPVTGSGSLLTYGMLTNTSLVTLNGFRGLAGFNLRLLGLGAGIDDQVTSPAGGGFFAQPQGEAYEGYIVPGSAANGVAVGLGLLTMTSPQVPIIGTLFDASNGVAPGTAVIAKLTSATFVVGVSQTVGSMATPVSLTTGDFTGIIGIFTPPAHPDPNYGQGFGKGGGVIQFPALLSKPAQSATPASPNQPEVEARPAIPSTQIVFYTGTYTGPQDPGSNSINYPQFFTGNAINMSADDVEIAIDTFGFSQGQAYLEGGGGGWRVPRAKSLYNDMRTDTGTFRVQDSYYADGTPGPMQLGSGAGSVHFASDDQTIEPQQAGISGTPTYNRPIDLIVDGARCFCATAAAVAVVATSDGSLATQSRTSVRNSTLLSGAAKCVVNVSNDSSSLSCQLYLENTLIDGWFQDADGACGILTIGQAGPADLTIGRNVRVTNAACQAMNCSGFGTIIISDDFLAGQPQINVVPNRTTGAGNLNWTQVPNAIVACTDSIVAGEFQAPFYSSSLAGSTLPGSPLQIGAPTRTFVSPAKPAIPGNADYTHVRVRLTYVYSGVYAVVITNATNLVIDSAVGVGATGSNGMYLTTIQPSGTGNASPAVNVCINSLHFERLGTTPITVDAGSSYCTNTGDIWAPPGATFPMQKSPSFQNLLDS